MLLKQMQYFMAIAECRHFTRAAERLFMSQSALSQQITKLESELGLKLINRVKHPVELTAEGREFQRYAEKILEDVAALQRRMQALLPVEKRAVRLGVITGLGNIDIAGILTSFSRNYPDINYAITNKLSKELCKMLAGGEIDLAIFAAPCDIDEYRFDVFPLEDEEFVLIMPSGHPLAGETEIALADVKNESFIFPTKDNVSYDIFTGECRKAGFAPRIVSECNGPGRRLDLVKAGLGIALISLSGLEYYNSPGIASVRLARPFFKRIVLARDKKKDASMILTILWQYIQQFGTAGNRDAGA